MLYEYPLNERTRTFLRLEQLYKRLAVLIEQDLPYSHHQALLTLFEIMDVGARSDLKLDILKELERNKAHLQQLCDNPEVEQSALLGFIRGLDVHVQAISNMGGKLGQPLTENDWLMSIRSRSGIPGGSCEFDLPALFAWQHQAFSRRQQDLYSWQRPLLPVYEAISQLLNLNRNQGQTHEVRTHLGQFQHSMQAGRSFALLRIEIDDYLQLIPEVSANRLVVMVRLMKLGSDGKLRASPDETGLRLTFCV